MPVGGCGSLVVGPKLDIRDYAQNQDDDSVMVMWLQVESYVSPELLCWSPPAHPLPPSPSKGDINQERRANEVDCLQTFSRFAGRTPCWRHYRGYCQKISSVVEMPD